MGLGARGGPYLARVDELAARGDVHDAGLIGAEFGIDPIEVLAERDPARRAIRLAAFQAVQTERAKAAQRKR